MHSRSLEHIAIKFHLDIPNRYLAKIDENNKRLYFLTIIRGWVKHSYLRHEVATIHALL